MHFKKNHNIAKRKSQHIYYMCILLDKKTCLNICDHSFLKKSIVTTINFLMH